MKNRIRELRETYAITQDELAKKCDVSRQTVISLEKGKYNPSIILAHRIAKIFKTTIEDIFIFQEDEE